MTAPNLSPGHDHGQGDGADGQHGEGGGGHAGHSHGVSADTDRRYLMGALALIVAFMAAEVAAGIVAHSLALISDAAHMLTDAGSIVLPLSAWLGYEAIRRLIAPPAVGGGLVLGTALAGVAVNLAAAWLMSKANRASLNIQGAYRHILTDLYAFIATAIAGLVIVVTGFARADALASLVVVALMVKAGSGLVRDSGRIFLEAAPAGLAPEK